MPKQCNKAFLDRYTSRFSESLELALIKPRTRGRTRTAACARSSDLSRDRFPTLDVLEGPCVFGSQPSHAGSHSSHSLPCSPRLAAQLSHASSQSPRLGCL